MTIFSVQHTTTYRYKNPVKPGRHQLMFPPRDSFDQRLLECNLKISPPPSEIRWIHDAFGNCITLVDFSTATTVLYFDTFIMLDHHPENAPDFLYRRLCADTDLAPYIRQHHGGDASVEQWLAKFVDVAKSSPTGQLLMTLNEAIAESFSYKRRSSRGTQIPSETISRQKGTCRDFALLILEA